MDDTAVAGNPFVTKTGKAEGIPVFHPDVVGGLFRVAFPFEKAGGRHQAATVAEGVFERGLFSQGFSPCIDEFVSD